MPAKPIKAVHKELN